jgi:hypothetical protein
MTKLNNRLIRSSSSLFALILLLTGSAAGQSSDRRDGMRFVPNVQTQFHDLSLRADGFGLHITTTPDPSTCKHYQGMVRAEGADGTPFFMVTRSGNTPSNAPGIICNDSPGEQTTGI